MRKDGQEVKVGNVESLASALDIPLTELVFDASFTRHGVRKILHNAKRACLCPVNIGATAAKAGFSCEEPTWDGRTRQANPWALRQRTPPSMPGVFH
jgi:hypothetical protein